MTRSPNASAARRVTIAVLSGALTLGLLGWVLVGDAWGCSGMWAGLVVASLIGSAVARAVGAGEP